MEGFVTLLQSYGIETVVGDHWGGDVRPRTVPADLVYKFRTCPRVRFIATALRTSIHVAFSCSITRV